MTEAIPHIAESLREVAGDLGPSCLALVQGYPATTFARLNESGLELPPTLGGSGDLPWQLFWDVRAFGQKGEFHAWKRANGSWKGRLRMTSEVPDRIERQYPVWGRPSGPAQNGWQLYSEERGTEVWVPEEAAQGASRLVLEVWQIVGEPRELPEELRGGGLSIIDAMIVGLIPSPYAEEE